MRWYVVTPQLSPQTQPDPSTECRRKKIKCDGKNPCTHCTVYSYGTSVPLWLAVARARTRI